MAENTFVILGMHKSGTTLVAKMLHRSGIEMEEAANSDGDYDRGEFFERSEFKALNVEVLGSGIPAYRDPMPRDIRLSAGQRERMRTLVRGLQTRGRPWGFKDPRTCLTYPLWEPNLPPHKLILVYRSPSEVWGHLSRHSSRTYHCWAALRSWCDHNRTLVAVAESARDDVLVLSFEALMTGNDEFERLQRFVELPLEDVREPQRYRIRARGGVAFGITSVLRRWLGRDDPNEIFLRLEELRSVQMAKAEFMQPERRQSAA